jgi:hypothetical protein
VESGGNAGEGVPSGGVEQPGGFGGVEQPGGFGGVEQPGGYGGVEQPGGSGGVEQLGGSGGVEQLGGSGGVEQLGGSGGVEQLGGSGGVEQPGGAGNGGSPEVAIQGFQLFIESDLILPLAPGGVNVIEVRLENLDDEEIEVTLSAEEPQLGFSLDAKTVALAPLGSLTTSLWLTGTDLSDGSGSATIIASAPGRDDEYCLMGLEFSDDMAQNTLGTAYPRATASSTEPSGHPVEFVNDDDLETFWVSGSVPSEAEPEWVTVDFGAPVEIGTITMYARWETWDNYGPSSYVIQTSDDGADWTDVETVTIEHEQYPVVTELSTPVTARLLRLYITETHVRVNPGPANNTQIRALVVWPPL